MVWMGRVSHSGQTQTINFSSQWENRIRFWVILSLWIRGTDCELTTKDVDDEGNAIAPTLAYNTTHAWVGIPWFRSHQNSYPWIPTYILGIGGRGQWKVSEREKSILMIREPSKFIPMKFIPMSGADFILRYRAVSIILLKKCLQFAQKVVNSKKKSSISRLYFMFISWIVR